MNHSTNNEFTLINYHGVNYKFTVLGVDYIRPQFHREIEVWLLLHGEISAMIDGIYVEMKKGDFCIVDTFKIHELKYQSENDVPILMAMHIHSDFFKNYYPLMNEIVFPLKIYNLSNMNESHYYRMVHDFIRMGIEYFKKEKHYEIKVAGMINLFFYNVMSYLTYEHLTEETKRATLVKVSKLKGLTDYIYEHYSEKLLLSDLADREGISMSRLSHVFKECFGRSFQEYLLRVRCESAKELLRATDMSLLDISMECGFSDPKYFNQGFKKIYGISPKDYRKSRKGGRSLSYGNNVEVKSGYFLTDEDCYLILEYCDQEIGSLEE